MKTTMSLLRQTAVLATVYYLSAAFGQVLAIPPGYITPVWPPSGIALAAVLVIGNAALPGILVGAFAANLHAGPAGLPMQIAAALMIALGSALQPLVGRLLCKRLGVELRPWLTRRSALAFVAAAALMCLVSATIGSTTLHVFGIAQVGLLRSLATWWFGDVLGVLVFTPLLLSLFRQSFESDRRRFLALILIMAGTSITVAALAITVAYRTFMESQEARMQELANTQANLMLKIAGSTATPGADALLDRLRAAYTGWEGVAGGARLLVARERNGAIDYVLGHGLQPDEVLPVGLPMLGDRALPVARALGGETGVMLGQDYRGVDVLAAYAALPQLGLGLVVQTEMDSMRAPFITSAALVTIVALLLVFVGVRWFQSISAPLIRNLQRQSDELQKLVDEQTLELRESEVRFKALLNSAPEAMVIVDSTGCMQLVNNKLCELTQYSVEELVGSRVEMLVPVELRDHHVPLREAYAAAPTPRLLDEDSMLFCERKDGTLFPVSISLNGIETAKGKVVAASLRDITRQKAHEERLVNNENRMTLALETGGMEVYEVDVDSLHIESNFLLYRKFGYASVGGTRHKLDDDPWVRIIHPDDRERVLKAVRAFTNGKARDYRIAYRVLASDGSIRWIETNGRIISRRSDGTPRKVLGLRRDVTDIIRSQHELQTKLDELEAFNKLAIGRELKMIELKQELNRLYTALGKEARYAIAE